MCCSVLQRVVVCCSVLQCEVHEKDEDDDSNDVFVKCIAVCCSVCCSVLQCEVHEKDEDDNPNDEFVKCVAVCCSVLQRVAVCCNVKYARKMRTRTQTMGL